MPDDTLVVVPACGLLIGRSNVCDIVLADEDASRRNTTLRILGGCLWVADEGSTNGTLVDEELTTRKRVGAGAAIVVGNTRMVVEEGDFDEGLPSGLADDWERFLEASDDRRRADAVEALRVLASAEACRMDPDGAVAINWAEGERGLDGLGPFRARLVGEALGILAGV